MAESGHRAFGEGQAAPPHQLWDSAMSSPRAVEGGALAAQRFSYILSVSVGVSCCILGAFCTRKLYAEQRGKGFVRFS